MTSRDPWRKVHYRTIAQGQARQRNMSKSTSGEVRTE